MKAKGFVECTVGIILLPLLCLLFDGILLCAAVYPALSGSIRFLLTSFGKYFSVLSHLGVLLVWYLPSQPFYNG